MKRYFAFGCSYTSYHWATVADYIGENFDFYRNLGNTGASNSFIMDRIFQAHEHYKFTSKDFVTVGTTGIGRFNFINKHTGIWMRNGDIFPGSEGHPDLCRLWSKEFDSLEFALHRSMMAIKWIKFFLESLQVPHVIYGAVTNYNAQCFTENRSKAYKMLKPFYDLHHIKETIDEFLVRTAFPGEEYGYKFLDGIDRHPSQAQHYRYFKQYFPQFDNEKTKSFYDRVEENFCLVSQVDQHNNWFDHLVRNHSNEI